MKSVVRLTLTAAAVSMAFGVASAAFAASPKLNTEKAKASYMVGMSMAGNIPAPVRDELDPAIVANAVETMLKGDKPAMSEDEAKEVGKAFSTKMRTKMTAIEKTAAAKNQKEGTAFLAANKGKMGVHVTASGLQYKVTTKGTGPKPKLSDTVQVTYTGRLLDGTVFDSSEQHGGTPATFGLSNVIKGWGEALQLMPVGSTYEIWIPSDLAYGEKSAGPIGPDSTLNFTVHLIKIMPPKAAESGETK